MKGQCYRFNYSAKFTIFGLFEVHALANQIPQWKVQFSDIDSIYILKTFMVKYVCKIRSMLLSCYCIQWVNLAAFPCIQTVVLLACLHTNKQTKTM